MPSIVLFTKKRKTLPVELQLSHNKRFAIILDYFILIGNILTFLDFKKWCQCIFWCMYNKGKICKNKLIKMLIKLNILTPAFLNAFQSRVVSIVCPHGIILCAIRNIDEALRRALAFSQAVTTIKIRITSWFQKF